MSIPVFPDIKQPSYPFNDKPEDPAIRSSMENGTVISRRKFTRNRQTFVLQWDNLSSAHYSILRNFYKNVVYGGSLIFAWTYPTVIGDDYSGQVFHVRFSSGVPDFSLTDFACRKGQITLEEA